MQRQDFKVTCLKCGTSIHVLPTLAVPQIPSAQGAVAGCHRAITEVALVLRSTWDDRGLRRQRQKWMKWSVLTKFFFLSERWRSRFCKRLYINISRNI